MKRIDDIDLELIKQEYRKDTQTWKIAKMIGRSESCVERNAKKLGLKKQRTGPKSGDRHPDWKGGRVLIGGYWYIYKPEHPNRTKAKRVAEHRLVMEEKLGRFLLKKEVVHHIDENPLNNHPDNLMVFGCNADHLRHELTGKCPNWTADGWARMQAGVRKKRTHPQLKSDD